MSLESGAMSRDYERKENSAGSAGKLLTSKNETTTKTKRSLLNENLPIYNLIQNMRALHTDTLCICLHYVIGITYLFFILFTRFFLAHGVRVVFLDSKRSCTTNTADERYSRNASNFCAKGHFFWCPHPLPSPLVPLSLIAIADSKLVLPPIKLCK